jgi:hypothetical protein
LASMVVRAKPSNMVHHRAIMTLRKGIIMESACVIPGRSAAGAEGKGIRRRRRCWIPFPRFARRG